MRSEDWAAVLRAATEEHRRPTQDQCIEIAWRLFPEKMRADQPAKARAGQVRDLKAAMKRAAPVMEDEETPLVQLELPGMKAPTYLKTKDADIQLTIVRYAKSFRPERKAAIKLRQVAVVRTQKRIEDMELKERYLDPYTPDDATTVEQALARKAEHDARRSRRQPKPNQPGAPA